MILIKCRGNIWNVPDKHCIAIDISPGFYAIIIL